MLSFYTLYFDICCLHHHRRTHEPLSLYSTMHTLPNTPSVSLSHCSVQLLLHVLTFPCYSFASLSRLFVSPPVSSSLFPLFRLASSTLSSSDYYTRLLCTHLMRTYVDGDNLLGLHLSISLFRSSSCCAAVYFHYSLSSSASLFGFFWISFFPVALLSALLFFFALSHAGGICVVRWTHIVSSTQTYLDPFSPLTTTPNTHSYQCAPSIFLFSNILYVGFLCAL